MHRENLSTGVRECVHGRVCMCDEVVYTGSV